MKIKIINPDYGMTRNQMDGRCKILQQYVAADVELYMECLKETKVYLDSVADGVFAGPEILKMAVEAERDGFQAIILYCFSDPVLEACRQLVSIPVIGAGQAACLMVPYIGYQCAILVSDLRRVPEKQISLSRTGLSMERILDFVEVEANALDPIDDKKELYEALLKAGQIALQRTKAQVLVMGCLTYLGFSEKLSCELGVPVVDAGAAAVAMAESIVRQGLFTSKKAYLDRKDMTYILYYK